MEMNVATNNGTFYRKLAEIHQCRIKSMHFDIPLKNNGVAQNVFRLSKSFQIYPTIYRRYYAASPEPFNIYYYGHPYSKYGKNQIIIFTEISYISIFLLRNLLLVMALMHSEINMTAKLVN